MSWRRSRGVREELARRRTFETALSGVRLHQLRLEPHCLQVGSRLQVGDDSCRRPTLESAGRATDRTARQPSADPASSEQNRQDNARIWIWIWHCRVLAVRSLALLRRIPFCYLLGAGMILKHPKPPPPSTAAALAFTARASTAGICDSSATRTASPGSLPTLVRQGSRSNVVERR